MFKKDFIFRKKNLVTTLHNYGLIVHGYLVMKQGKS